METISVVQSVLESATMKDRDVNVVLLATYVAGIKLGARKRGKRFFGECAKLVGDYLGVSRQTVYEWVDLGDLGGVRDPKMLSSFADISGIEMKLLIQGVNVTASKSN